MNKTPLRLGLVCFCFAPLTAFALGVGQVTVRSALNQPLNADIELFSVKPSEFSNLKVVITPQSFTGSSAGPALFDYVLESRKDGRSFLKIRSKQSIREPLLNFRVAIEWPSGRLNRDFAVLLDPPGADGGVSRLAESVAPPIATPKRGKTAEGGQRATMAAPSSATGGEGGSSYGPVGHGETLWSIAARTRPDASISVQRMMQALMAANPHAFSRPARANRLYAGVTLRVPGADEISTHSIRKASIAQQRERVVKPASSPTVATASAQPRPAPKPDDKAVVRLLPPDSAGADNAPAADGAARVAVEGGALKLKTAQLTDLQARINALAGTDTQALLANPEAASAPPPADAASAPTTPSREEPANAAAKTIEPADRPRPAGTAPTHSGTNAAAPTTDATQPVTPKTEEVSAGGQAHSSAPRPAPAPSNTEPKPTEKVKDSTPTASAQTQTAEPSTAPAATSSSSTAPAPTQLASTTAESKPATATPTTTSAATASSQSKPPATPAKPDDSAAAVIATPAPTPPTPVADTTAKAAPPPSDFSRYVNIALDFAMGSILTVRNFFKDPALGDWTKDLTGELTEDPQKLAMLGGGGVLLLGLLLMMVSSPSRRRERRNEFGADEQISSHHLPTQSAKRARTKPRPLPRHPSLHRRRRQRRPSKRKPDRCG
ncbi:MAG: FimV/HubP family polar landmark protein [Gammaproteobacteria bacterium]